MTCASSCPDEKQQQDSVSPGPVANYEEICRGAYGKTMHYKNSKVRPSFVKNNDLLAGSLSVWRNRDKTDADVSAITAVLTASGPSGAILFDLFSATTERVRGIRVIGQPSKQVLHVYDDCRTDDTGGRHPLHAVVAICNDFDPSGLEKDSPTYIEIRDSLVNLFKQNTAWALPEAERL